MAKKQTLKDIQDMYNKKLERVKLQAISDANKENAELKKEIVELKEKLSNCSKGN